MSWEIIQPNFFFDERGTLSIIQSQAGLPFLPKRVFWVCGVPEGATRGQHAHRTGQQLLFCLSGEISAMFFDGSIRETALLKPDGIGVWMKSLVWGEQTFLKPDTILLVLASNEFDSSDYIRDKEEFNLLTKKTL